MYVLSSSLEPENPKGQDVIVLWNHTRVLRCPAASDLVGLQHHVHGMAQPLPLQTPSPEVHSVRINIPAWHIGSGSSKRNLGWSKASLLKCEYGRSVDRSFQQDLNSEEISIIVANTYWDQDATTKV